MHPVNARDHLRTNKHRHKSTHTYIYNPSSYQKKKKIKSNQRDRQTEIYVKAPTHVELGEAVTGPWLVLPETPVM